MIEVSELSKSYGVKQVLINITFNAEKGIKSIYGLNGSGKTTLMEIIAGIKKPSNGIVRISGTLGYMPQEPQLYDEFKVKDYITLVKSTGGNSEILGEMLHRLDIPFNAHIYELSYGMKKSVYLSIALSDETDIYALDEPFLGIDVERREVLLKYMQKISEKRLILITESERILEPDWILKGGALYEA